MDFKEMLEKEFDSEKNILNNESTIPNSESLSVDSFVDNYKKYKEKISAKSSMYEKLKEESIKVHESRLKLEALNREKETKYNLFKDNLSSGKYYDAFIGFESIIDYKDSESYYNQAKSILDEKYNEAMNLFNDEQFDEAKVAFLFLSEYKDSRKMVERCQVEIDKKGEKAAKRKKILIFTSLFSSLACIITLVLILVFTVFIPKSIENKYNRAIRLINERNYNEAASILEKLNYKDSANQYNVAKAGISAKEGTANNVIKYMCDANGKISVTYNPNGGTTPVLSEEIETYKPMSNYATKDYYQFMLWEVESYTITTKENEYSCQLNLIASYVIKRYQITYSLDGGTNNSANPETYNGLMDNIQLQNPTKEGYTFLGWYYNNELITEINTKNDFDIEIVALWANYTLTTEKNIDSAGRITEYYNQNITEGTSITITASTNTGYTFLGWYKDNKIVTTNNSHSFTMPNVDLIYEARWSINKYKITLNNQSGFTVSGVTSGNAYEYGTQINLVTNNSSNLVAVIWSRSDGIITTGNTYSFNVPANNIDITITSITVYTKSGNKLYFGTYPQTIVTESTLINNLNNLAGEKPTANKFNNWLDYNYYILGGKESYMFYKDIDYDCNGTYDYRGVYFIKYRPSSVHLSESYSYQDDNGYDVNTIYWFKYDKIEWDIINNNDGKALIVANLILDSQEYYPFHNSKSNNYELSNIRKWLNASFYNTAFNALQKELISTTLVDNSLKSTGNTYNDYVCDDTYDKIFLLSREEYQNYYSNPQLRSDVGTDYAKAQGLFVQSNNTTKGKSNWLLRSPYNLNVDDVYSLYVMGGYSISVGSLDISLTYGGVRPACWVKL